MPAAPSVTATADSGYQVTVQWTDSSPGITGFYVDNGCPAGACGETDIEEYKTLGVVYSTTFAQTPGTYTCFHALAISSAGDSPYSGWACLTTPGLTLSGSTQWLDTGVSLNAGDGVGIRASGTITVVAGGSPLGPDGETCTVDTNRADLQAPCYSLIGRIGNGDPFEIGSAVQLTGVSGGELYIGVNDDNFGDNTGSWSVRIAKGGSLPP